jgi:hypothetical protein
MKMIEAGARAICNARDISPDTLYQDETPPKFPEDGHFINSRGERCSMHYAWRKYVVVSQLVIEAALAAR